MKSEVLSGVIEELQNHDKEIQVSRYKFYTSRKKVERTKKTKRRDGKLVYPVYHQYSSKRIKRVYSINRQESELGDVNQQVLTPTCRGKFGLSIIKKDTHCEVATNVRTKKHIKKVSKRDIGCGSKKILAHKKREENKKQKPGDANDSHENLTDFEYSRTFHVNSVSRSQLNKYGRKRNSFSDHKVGHSANRKNPSKCYSDVGDFSCCAGKTHILLNVEEQPPPPEDESGVEEQPTEEQPDNVERERSSQKRSSTAGCGCDTGKIPRAGCPCCSCCACPKPQPKKKGCCSCDTKKPTSSRRNSRRFSYQSRDTDEFCPRCKDELNRKPPQEDGCCVCQKPPQDDGSCTCPKGGDDDEDDYEERTYYGGKSGRPDSGCCCAAANNFKISRRGTRDSQFAKRDSFVGYGEVSDFDCTCDTGNVETISPDECCCDNSNKQTKSRRKTSSSRPANSSDACCTCDDQKNRRSSTNGNGRNSCGARSGDGRSSRRYSGQGRDSFAGERMDNYGRQGACPQRINALGSQQQEDTGCCCCKGKKNSEPSSRPRSRSMSPENTCCMYVADAGPMNSKCMCPAKNICSHCKKLFGQQKPSAFNTARPPTPPRSFSRQSASFDINVCAHCKKQMQSINPQRRGPINSQGSRLNDSMWLCEDCMPQGGSNRSSGEFMWPQGGNNRNPCEFPRREGPARQSQCDCVNEGAQTERRGGVQIIRSGGSAGSCGSGGSGGSYRSSTSEEKPRRSKSGGRKGKKGKNKKSIRKKGEPEQEAKPSILREILKVLSSGKCNCCCHSAQAPAIAPTPGGTRSPRKPSIVKDQCCQCTLPGPRSARPSSTGRRTSFGSERQNSSCCCYAKCKSITYIASNPNDFGQSRQGSKEHKSHISSKKCQKNDSACKSKNQSKPDNECSTFLGFGVAYDDNCVRKPSKVEQNINEILNMGNVEVILPPKHNKSLESIEDENLRHGSSTGRVCSQARIIGEKKEIQCCHDSKSHKAIKSDSAPFPKAKFNNKIKDLFGRKRARNLEKNDSTLTKSFKNAFNRRVSKETSPDSVKIKLKKSVDKLDEGDQKSIYRSVRNVCRSPIKLFSNNAKNEKAIAKNKKKVKSKKHRGQTIGKENYIIAAMPSRSVAVYMADAAPAPDPAAEGAPPPAEGAEPPPEGQEAPPAEGATPPAEGEAPPADAAATAATPPAPTPAAPAAKTPEEDADKDDKKKKDKKDKKKDKKKKMDACQCPDPHPKCTCNCKELSAKGTNCSCTKASDAQCPICGGRRRSERSQKQCSCQDVMLEEYEKQQEKQNRKKKCGLFRRKSSTKDIDIEAIRCKCDSKGANRNYGENYYNDRDYDSSNASDYRGCRGTSRYQYSSYQRRGSYQDSAYNRDSHRSKSKSKLKCTCTASKNKAREMEMESYKARSRGSSFEERRRDLSRRNTSTRGSLGRCCGRREMSQVSYQDDDDDDSDEYDDDEDEDENYDEEVRECCSCKKKATFKRANKRATIVENMGICCDCKRSKFSKALSFVNRRIQCAGECLIGKKTTCCAVCTIPNMEATTQFSDVKEVFNVHINPERNKDITKEKNTFNNCTIDITDDKFRKVKIMVEDLIPDAKTKRRGKKCTAEVPRTYSLPNKEDHERLAVNRNIKSVHEKLDRTLA